MEEGTKIDIDLQGQINEINQDLQALSRYMGTSGEKYHFTSLNLEEVEKGTEYIKGFINDEKIDRTAEHITEVLWGCGDENFKDKHGVDIEQFARIAFVIAHNHDLMLQGEGDSFVNKAYAKLLLLCRDEKDKGIRIINEQCEIVTGKDISSKVITATITSTGLKRPSFHLCKLPPGVNLKGATSGGKKKNLIGKGKSTSS